MLIIVFIFLNWYCLIFHFTFKHHFLCFEAAFFCFDCVNGRTCFSLSDLKFCANSFYSMFSYVFVSFNVCDGISGQFTVISMSDVEFNFFHWLWRSDKPSPKQDQAWFCFWSRSGIITVSTVKINTPESFRKWSSS